MIRTSAGSAVVVILAILLASASRAAESPSDTASARSRTPAAASAATTVRDECFNCHLEVDGGESQAYRNDIHFVRGVTCADCHGGDPSSDDKDVAMGRAAGYRGVPKKAQIPQVCGRCHGPESNALKTRYRLEDVLTGFREGAHGHALEARPDGPTCLSCHGVHGITRVADPRSPAHASRVVETCAHCHSDAGYMKEFNPSLAVDQRDKYLTSVHGKRHAAGDLKAATCVSCHSNHLVYGVKDSRSPVYPTRIPKTCAGCHSNARYMAGYGIPTSQYDDYVQSVHGRALLERSDLNAPACNSCHGNHGASPPGAASVTAVCGQCHQLNAELFQKSAHQAVFEHEKLPGCVVCHGNHRVLSPSDSLVSLKAGSPCARCHAGKPGDRHAAGVTRMRELLDSLRTGQKGAIAALDKAENLGMDVSEARYSLKDVNQSVVKSRVAIHSFKVKDLEEAARPGTELIVRAREAGIEAIRQYQFRRQGLGISTLIVTLLGLLLWLKIKDIEKQQRQAS